MSRAKMLVEVYSNTSNVAAVSQVQSAWLDYGAHRGPSLEVTRTNTAGTYAFEVDWSQDAGDSTLTTDTITVPSGEATQFPAKARWYRLRVKNTHGTNAFTAHSTVVKHDTSAGR